MFVKNFCLPSDFKFETIDKYREINEKYEHSRVIETYGQLAPDTLFGSCRSPGSLPGVDINALEKYVSYSAERHIEFNYIMNATCMSNSELTRAGVKKSGTFLKQLQDIGVNWVTISMPSMMEIAKYYAPDMNIKASTVCQINSPAKAKFFQELGIKRIVLDEDINRKFDILKNIRKVYTGSIEIIVNSFCVNDCPYKMSHYNSFSHSHEHHEKYGYFSKRCRSMHLGAENCMKLNWIRPEDLHYYTEIGIDCFKLQGRTNVLDGDPARAVIHYAEEYYDGNLISLLELFSASKPLSITPAEIDNRKLDGFFERFAKNPHFCGRVCDECDYCRTYADAGMSPADTAVMDLMKLADSITINEYPKSLAD